MYKNVVITNSKRNFYILTNKINIMPINIATAIDSLVEVIKTKKKITLEDASKFLGLPMNIIHEWANFLEEEGLIKITYKFTTPYLEIKEKAKTEEDVEDLKRKLDLATRKLQTILSKLEKVKVQHKYEINNLTDVKLLLRNSPNESSPDYVYAQKFILVYNITEVLDTIRKIKMLTPDLMKFIEKKVKDIEERRLIFEHNYNNLK